jgi:predicted nucleotidyltransferase
LNAKEETMYYLQKKVIFSIKNIKESINIFFKEYPIFDNLINTVYLFGSYAKNKNDEYSDVDLFFEFKKKDENIILFEQLIKNFMKTRFNMDIDVLIHFKGENFNNFENKILSYSVKLK